jgi:3-hydroxymyristoyl/3-hydroxydecanoyl-(acyl carrier protein) dehydratase
MTVLDYTAICDRIPHRYQNMLLDTVTITSPDSSDFSLHISPNDTLGRTLFWDNHSPPQLPTPLTTEIAALACISSSGAIKPGYFAYFAGISNFTLTGGPCTADTPIQGATQKRSHRNGFYKHAFTLSCGDTQARGDLTAFYTQEAPSEPNRPDPVPPMHPDALAHPVAIAPFAYKNPHMTFIDTRYTHQSGYALYGLTYSLQHPLTRGHFPGNPVMMGVSQWQMLEDTVTDLHHRSELSAGVWQMDARIVSDTFIPICDMKGMVLSISPQGIVTTIAARKIAFKQRVSPGDRLILEVSSIQSAT